MLIGMLSEAPLAARASAIAQMLVASRYTVVLTGAGISTESGIPDFRGPNGLWSKDPEAEKLSDIRYYMGSEDIRQKAWRARLAHPAWTAHPNDAHLVLAEMERKGLLQLLMTQNVDGLHQKAGNSPAKVVEVHGTLFDVTCMSCGDIAPMQTALERVKAGEADPHCLTCGGILKSATVSFGQSLDPDDLARCEQACRRCDLLITAGTSLQVYPVAALPSLLASHADLVVLNQEPTPYDEAATQVIREPLSVSLGAILTALGEET